MKYTPLSLRFALDSPDEDCQTGVEFGNLRAGELAIYHCQFLRTSYLPYSAVSHSFLRCEEVRAKMCCGSFNDDQIYLVLVDLEGMEYQLHLDSKQDGDRLLEIIAERQPNAKIGYYKT